MRKRCAFPYATRVKGFPIIYRVKPKCVSELYSHCLVETEWNFETNQPHNFWAERPKSYSWFCMKGPFSFQTFEQLCLYVSFISTFLYSLVIFLWRMIDIDHLFAPVNMNLNGFLWSMNSLHFLPSFQVCVTYFMISSEIQLGEEFLLILFYLLFLIDLYLIVLMHCCLSKISAFVITSGSF